MRALLVFSSLICLALGAQDPVRVDVRLVNVYATVIDSTGRYIGGLTKNDFQVEEDGKRQTLTHFSQDQDSPITVGIVFDKSGSMVNKIRTATDAVDHFAKTVHKDDDIFIIAFDSQVSVIQDFTSDRSKLTKALNRMEAGGGTALYDALESGLEKIRGGAHNKRAILLITDGQDTDSQTSFSTTRQSIRESELLVYALGISPNSTAAQASPGRPGLGGRDTVNMDVLKLFAADSGGRAYQVSENMLRGQNSQFERILSQIAEELRSQYTLGYYPTHGDDGQFHNITVRTRFGYAVRARPGYVAK